MNEKYQELTLSHQKLHDELQDIMSSEGSSNYSTNLVLNYYIR